MYTDLDDIKAISTYFVQVMDPTVPIVFDNDPAVHHTSMFARLSVNPGVETAITLGLGKFEQKGRIALQVHVPEGTGDGLGRAYLDSFIQSFRYLDLDNYRIRFTSFQQSKSDDTDKNGFFMLFATGQYRADHY